MANTPDERLKIKQALTLIANKYADWIGGNQRVLAIMGANDNQLDILVKFLDEQAFMVNYQVTNNALPAGCQLNGYVDLVLNPPFQVFINRTRANPSTLIHEFLHLLSHENFNRNVTKRLDEGVTEYFTRKVQGEANQNAFAAFAAPRQSYNTELNSVIATRTHIKTFVNPMLPEVRGQGVQLGRQRNMDFIPDPAGGRNTEDMVKRAYFRGEMAMINLIKENSNI